MSDTHLPDNEVLLYMERILCLERDDEDCLVPVKHPSYLKAAVQRKYTKYVSIGNIDVIHPKDCLPNTRGFAECVIRCIPQRLLRNTRGYTVRPESEIKASAEERVKAIEADKNISRVRLIGVRG